MVEQLTEAEKQALLAQATTVVDEPPVEVVDVVNDGPITDLDTAFPPSTQKIGPDMEPAPLLAGAVSHNPTQVVGDVGEWGPYSDYQVVNVGFGEFGLERGKVLFFEEEQRFSAKSGQFITIHAPRYRDPDQSQESAIAEHRLRESKRPVRA